MMIYKNDVNETVFTFEELSQHALNLDLIEVLQLAEAENNLRIMNNEVYIRKDFVLNMLKKERTTCQRNLTN